MSDIQNLTGQQVDEDTRERLRSAWKRSYQSRRKASPAEHFPWHEKQQWVLKDVPTLYPNPTRIIQINGGNRSGKSKLAMGVISEILDRTSPYNDQFRTTDPMTGKIRPLKDHEPIRIWVVPPTLEKFREDWVNPADQMGLRYWMGDGYITHKLKPDYVFLGKPPGLSEDDLWGDDGRLREDKCDRVLGKSHDAKLETFEASEIHVAIIDEEPRDEDIITSVLMRLGTSNGLLMMPATPIHGLSWSWDRWWKPYVKQGRATEVAEKRWMYVPDDEEMGSKVFVQMGMAENPRAETYAREILEDPARSQAEKDARVHGEYGYVEGALLPRLSGLDLVTPDDDQRVYVVHDLPEPHNIAEWYLVADPNKSYGALLSCVDTDGNLFFVSEHLREDWPNRLHAKKFKEMERKYSTSRVNRYADPGSAGAQSMVDLEDFGLYFDNVSRGAGSVSRSIKQLRGLAWVDPNHVHPITSNKGAPRVYFYAPGLLHKRNEGGMTTFTSKLCEQMSQARQKEGAPPDTPDKDSKKLDLFDCARYTADIVQTHGPEETKRKPVKRENRLPRDRELHDRSDSIKFGLNRDFDIPTYDF